MSSMPRNSVFGPFSTAPVFSASYISRTPAVIEAFAGAARQSGLPRQLLIVGHDGDVGSCAEFREDQGERRVARQVGVCRLRP